MVLSLTNGWSWEIAESTAWDMTYRFKTRPIRPAKNCAKWLIWVGNDWALRCSKRALWFFTGWRVPKVLCAWPCHALLRVLSPKAGANHPSCEESKWMMPSTSLHSSSGLVLGAVFGRNKVSHHCRYSSFEVCRDGWFQDRRAPALPLPWSFKVGGVASWDVMRNHDTCFLNPTDIEI